MKTNKLLVLTLLCITACLSPLAVANEPLTNQNPVLLWLVIDKNGTTEFVAGDLHEAHIKQLLASAQGYGVNLLFPMLDLSERLMLQEQDVAEFKWDRILAVSARYNAPSIVAGKLTQQDGGWICQWQIYNPTQPLSWVATGKELHEQFVMITERLASTQNVQRTQVAATATAVKQHVKIRVKGVNSIEAYSKLIAYLESLAIVARVELNGLLADEASFTLNTEADKLSVAQAIAQDSVLRPIENNNSSNNYLEYTQT